jgi:hypothetical protein
MASVIITEAPNVLNNELTLTAACSSSAPMTIRSGCKKSFTAVPSRKNSGLDTTDISLRPIMRSTATAEPTGTVDLFTTMEPSLMSGPISVATADINDISGAPSSRLGVGRQRKMNSASLTARDAPTTKCNLPEANPSLTISARPSS